MRVIIIGNSPEKSFKKNYIEEENDYIITCDNGIKELDPKKTDLAIGDFDSGGRILANKALKKKTFAVKKDQTDLELALMEVENLQNVSEILIYDACGGRIDHYLINLKLIAKYQRKHECTIKLIGEKEIIKYLEKGEHLIQNNNYEYLSLINFNEAIVSLEGLEYNLSNYLLTKDNTMTSSNKFKEEIGKITILSGSVFLVLIKKGPLN